MRRLLYTLVAFFFLANSLYAATELQDEGVKQGYINRLNFTGGGVTASKSGITGTINVPAGSGAGDLKADGTVPLTADWEAGNSLYDITAVEFKGDLVGGDVTVGGGNITCTNDTTFQIKANSENALLISDGTTVVMRFDTRNTVTGVTSSLFTQPAAQTLVSGAGSTYSLLGTADFTLTLTGGVGVTALNGGSMNIGQPTYTSPAPTTVTTASSLYVKGAPVEAGSVTITNPYSLHVGAGNSLLGGDLTATGTIEGGTITDSTFSVTGGVVTGASIDADTNTITNIAIGAECTGASTDLTDTTSIAMLGDNEAVTGAWTFSGDIQLGETDIKLDAVLSGDETWSGITISGTSGVTTLAVGDLCYLNNDDGRWELVDANLSDGYDKLLGICVLAAADGVASEFLIQGKIRSATFPAFTVGSPLYISETAGDMTHTAPTTTDAAIRVIGYAVTAEDLMFCPKQDYCTHI